MASLGCELPGVMMAAHVENWEKDDARHDMEDLTSCLQITMSGFSTEDLQPAVQRTVCPIAATIEGACPILSCTDSVEICLLG